MKKDLKKREKGFGSLKRSLLTVFLSIVTAVVMLTELALPVYANSEAQGSTGDASEERGFVSVTSTGVSTVYDDQPHSGTVVVKTGELNKAYTVYYNTNGVPLTEVNYRSYGSPDVPAFKDAGDHTVFYLAVSEGYEPQGGSYTVSIEKAPLSVKAPDAELIYGDPPAEKALNHLSTELSALTITGLKGEDTAEKALSGTPAYHTAYAQYGDVGAYDITLSGLSSSNYELTLLPGTLTVSPKEVHFAWTGTASFEYNGKEQKLEVPTVEGLVGSDAVTAVCSGHAATHAGNYTARVTGLSGKKAGNYSFAANEATASKAWTITQAANEWTTKPTLLYATGTEPRQYSYLAAADYGEVTVDGIEYDEESKTYTLSVHVEGTNDFNGIEETMATYKKPDTSPTMEPTLADGKTITLTYGQALVTVENGIYEKGYTTDYHTGDPAGTYQIVKDPEEGKIYTPSVITVKKQEVALTWSKPDTFSWDGKEHAVTASVTAGLVGRDSVYVTAYQDNSKADAGSYTAYATAFGGTGAENYTIKNAETGYAWRITAAENAFTTPLSMSGWTYGESPKEPAAAAKYGAVSYTYYTDSACQNKTTTANSGALAEGGKPVKAGTWYVRASVPADAGAGYGELTSDAVPFTIGKRSLLLTAEDKNSPVGEAIAELTYTMTGSLAAGDTADGIGITIATNATSGSSVGTYPIKVTVDAEKSANYEVSTVDGSYFVALKMSVNASGYSQAYDGAEHGITVNVTEPSSGATIKYGESADSCTQAASPTIKNVSDSPKTVYFKVTAENYADYTGSATITITKSINGATVTLEHTQLEYNGAEQTVSITGVVLSDGTSLATGDYDISGNTGTDKGNYTLTVTGKGKYSGTATASWAITAKPMTVTAENVSATYDGQPHGITVAVSDPASGSSIKYGTTAGTYNLTESPTITNVSESPKTVYYQIAADNYNYETYTGSATITISEADAVPSTVTANNSAYDGTAHQLISEDKTTLVGGDMQYALGENGSTAPTTGWSTSIPTKTDAGTYYVWYKVVVDDNHNDTGVDYVPVTIAQASIAKAVVTLNNTALDYTGSEQSVTVTGVKLGEKTLTAGTDYEVTDGTTGTNKGTYTVTIIGKGNYKDAAKAKWTIGLVTPTISTIPTASAITYGQTLKDSTLSGGVAKNGDAEVAGTFAWKDATIAPSVSDSETTEYDVVFTPTDTENYGTAECKVKLTVNPASEPEDTSDGDTTFTPGDTESGVQGLDKESVEKQMDELAEADETPCGDNQTKDVKVTLDVSSTSETSVGSDEKSAILSIVGDQDGVQVDYLEITIEKSVTLYDVDGNGNKTNPKSETTTMHELGRVVDIPVKYDMTGKQNPAVARYHDGHTAVFTRLDAAPAAADMMDGTFYIEGSGKDAIIHIYSSLFSTFAILTNAETAAASPAVITVAPAAKDLTWTGAAQELVTAGTAEGGTMQYALGADATTAPAEGWSEAIPAGTNAGTYYVWYRAVGDAAHTESATGCVAVEIKKAKAVITAAPAAVPGLIWTGTPQALVTAGTAEGGTVIYALEVDATTAPADGWSETVPAATEAGTYYVWYKAVGDANHIDCARDCVVAAIAQKEREKPSGDMNPLLKTKGLKALMLTWTPMANVDGYDVFMARSTKNFGDEPYATLTPEASQMEFGNLKKKTAYKVNIRAFVLKDGVKEYVGQNETLYSITGGANQKYTNAAKISAKDMSLAVGDKKQAKVTVKGQKKGKAILSHGVAVRYLSSDPTIATVSDKGFVRGVGEGSCTIFLSTHNGLRATITVTVTGGPEELKFDKKSYKLSVGKTLKLKKELTLLPKGAKAELKWKSSDKKIATVDENGKVTARKAGTVTITVTASNGVTATVKIKIK